MRRGVFDRRDRARTADGELWRLACAADAPEDESGRFLDLAAFADGRLDDDARERVADWLAGDPVAAADVAAARLLGAAELPGAAPAALLARAVALVPAAPQAAPVVLFPARRRAPPPLPVLARWVSLAAATLLAGWLGFTLGAGTSLSLAQRGQSDGGLFNELLDQPAGFLRDLTDGAQT